MPPLLQEFLMSLLRKALTVIATWLIAQGWISEADSEKYIIGFSLFVISVLWSLWQRYKDRVNFLTALDSPPNTPEPVVKAMAKQEGSIRNLMMPCLLIATLAGSACAGKNPPVVVAQTSLGLTQAIGQLQVAGESLHKGGAINTQTAINLQEKLLALNNRVKAVIPTLKAFEELQQTGGKPSFEELSQLLDAVIAISQDLSIVVAGVPVAEATKALLDVVRETQRSIALTMVEIVRLREALES